MSLAKSFRRRIFVETIGGLLALVCAVLTPLARLCHVAARNDRADEGGEGRFHKEGSK